MNKNIEFLNQKKIRLTPQRLLVYEILKKKGHATADEIFKEALKTHPALSFATVYTILELFKNKGFVSEIRIDFERSTFDITTTLHHHFLCKNCSLIYDLDFPTCSALDKKNIQGHSIESFQGYLYGICKSCKEKRRRA